MPDVNLPLSKKQQKKFFRLEAEMAVIVPTTAGIHRQQSISSDIVKRRVDEVRKYFSKKFGGYTSVHATGGYVKKDGQLVKERVYKVTAFADKSTFLKRKNMVLRQVGSWARRWGQETVGFEFEGDLLLIPRRRR